MDNEHKKLIFILGIVLIIFGIVPYILLSILLGNWWSVFVIFMGVGLLALGLYGVILLGLYGLTILADKIFDR